ncbi:hypothetical protein CM15mP35_03060 [bacterium]|nr:MAG: hypothetical protein CM15mP35_03060 [bacterium]
MLFLYQINFYPVGTVAAISWFKKQKYHTPIISKPGFAYAKDDGFELKVHRGRRDFENKWNSMKKIGLIFS